MQCRQRTQRGVLLAEFGHRGLALVGGNGARFEIDHGLRILAVGTHAGLQALRLPPLPADDRAKPQRYTADDADGIAANPTADPLTLFMLVEQIIHVRFFSLPNPPERAGTFTHCRDAAGRRDDQSAATSEPSEDTAKRATFAVANGRISTVWPRYSTSTADALPMVRR